MKSREELEKIIQTLNRKYTFDDAHIELASDARMDDIIKFVREELIPDEPMSISLGLEFDDEAERFVRSMLKENISLLLVTYRSDEIIAVRLANTLRKAGDSTDIANLKHEKYQIVIKFLGHKDEELNPFDKFGVEVLVHFLMLGVDRRYRKRGLASKLMAAAVEFYSKLGLEKTVLKGEGSSNFSKRAYEKCGFEILHEFPYDDYKVDGEVVFKNMGEHKSCKLYAKLISVNNLS